MIDRRELFRNALGAAAGALVPALWVPKLVTPKAAAAAVPVPGRTYHTVIPYQGESFAGIDRELIGLWRCGFVPATMIMTARQKADLIRRAGREKSGILTALVVPFAPGCVSAGRVVGGYHHPVVGDPIEIHVRRYEHQDEIWFCTLTPEQLDGYV